MPGLNPLVDPGGLADALNLEQGLWAAISA